MNQTLQEKPQLSFWQIWNMSFGFLGIQFGFALQGGNMSRIFQSLGADNGEIPLYWIAAPLTGMLIQPIVGYMSDRTWHPKLGRRRPYFLVGAILSTIVLIFVPNSPVLWMAVGSLWILDASINISMEPFRALVADKLSESQRTFGFVVQALIIGIGTWIASNLPWFVKNVLGYADDSNTGIPLNVKIAFLVGGLVFLISILYTVFTTKEYPPEDIDKFKEDKKATSGFSYGFKEIIDAIKTMPLVMRKIGAVQFFSWFAFFTMWANATPALSTYNYHAPIPIEENYNMDEPSEAAVYKVKKESYDNSADDISSKMGWYGLSSMAFALILVFFSFKLRINRKIVHLTSLIAGGIGFLLMYFIEDSWILTYSFVLIGLAWGSILSMPYAMLSSSINHDKMGIYMGIFNMFITIPQILAGLIQFLLFSLIFEGNIIRTMIMAGVCLIIAGLLNLRITEKEAIR